MLASVAVTRAYREAAITAVGTALTPDEMSEGIDRLNGFLFSLFASDIGENLMEWQVPQQLRRSPYVTDAIALGFPNSVNGYNQPFGPAPGAQDISSQPPPNVRLMCRVTAPTTVFFPEQPSDGARMAYVDLGSTWDVVLDGNGRLIEGATSITLAPGSAPQNWFYRGDLGTWIPVATLTETDSLPLPPEFDDLLIAGTAIRLTGLDEIDPTSATMMIYNRLLKSAKDRYLQKGSTSFGGQNLPGSVQAFGGYRDGAW